MDGYYVNSEFKFNMFRETFGAVDATVLSTCTSEGNHKVRESPFYEACYVMVGQIVYSIEEVKYFAVVFEEQFNGLVESRHVFIGFEFTGIRDCAAVEHVSAPVAGRIVGDAVLIGETKDSYC